MKWGKAKIFLNHWIIFCIFNGRWAFAERTFRAWWCAWWCARVRNDARGYWYLFIL